VIEVGTPDACYAILAFEIGQWRATFRQVPYDHRAMAQLARDKQQADWASALETGRLPPAA
jgi:hypothetical protein